jgi:Ca2+-binding RTX toxin-like protein
MATSNQTSTEDQPIISQQTFNAAFSGFSETRLNSLWNICKLSPELQELIAMAGSGKIVVGAENSGTYTHSGAINVDPSYLLLPDTTLLVVLGHELGHLDDPQGNLNVTEESTLQQGIQVGLQNEGVAELYENIVSAQLSANSQTDVPMFSKLPEAYSNEVLNLAKLGNFNVFNFSGGLIPISSFRTNIINIGATFTAQLHPSSSPALTYESLSADEWIFARLSEDQINGAGSLYKSVNWSAQNNGLPVIGANGQYSFQNWNISTKSGPSYVVSGVFSSWGVPSWETFLTQNNGEATSEIVRGTQPLNADGTPVTALEISNISNVSIRSGTTATITGNGDTITFYGSNSSVTLQGSQTDKLFFGTGDGPIPLAGGVNAIPSASNPPGIGVWTDSHSNITYSYNDNSHVLTITFGNHNSNSVTINGFNINAAVGAGFDGITLTQSASMSFGNASAAIQTTNVAHIVNTNSANSSALAGTADGSETTSNTVVPISISDLVTSADSTNVVLTATGNTSGLYVDEGSTLVSLASGSATLSIAAGASNVTFGLVDQNPSTQNQTVTLTATVADSSNPNDTSTTNSETVTFNGITTPPAGTVINSVTGTLPNDPTANASIVPATFYQLNDNNDVVTAGSGSNIIADGILGYLAGNAGGTNFSIGNGMVSNPHGYAGAIWAFAAGNDTISGGGGQGVIAVGNGNNQIFAGSATSLSTALTQVQSATASNTNGYYIAVGDGNNTIVGGAGNDYVEVGEGNNTIALGPGADTFIGGVEVQANYLNWSATFPLGSAGPFNAPPGYEGATLELGGTYYPLGTGNDTIFGGTGNSLIDLPNGNNYVDAGGGNDYIWASTGSSTIFGGSGNDLILGGGGNNYIDGESGNDSIVGEGGNSTIFGGTGNDTIYAGDNNSSWASSQTSNNSYLDAGSGNTVLYGAGGNDTLFGGSGNDSLYGGNGNEDIEAGSGTTSMGGGTGNDTLIGGSGTDSIYGGSGTDSIQAGSGNDSIGGGAGTETITGGSGNDVIAAGNGNVTINGGSGYMVITGGSGNDSIATGDGGTDAAPDQVTAGSGSTTIVGGAGVNNLFGGAGNDVIYAGNGGDAGQRTYVTAGTGSNTIYGGNGPDDITAGVGVDVIYTGDGGTSAEATFINGGKGQATIYGGAGYDQVSMGGGSDTIVTGTGNMSIVGGSGTGTYEISSNSGNVNIYSPGASDTLEFGAGISIADVTAQTATFPGNVSGIVLTLNSGAQVAVEQGGLSQVSFAGGLTATFSQLLSPQFTIGNTTYSSVNGVLPDVSDTTSSQTESPGHVLGGDPAGKTTATTATTQNLTLTGTADLSATGNNVNDVLAANAGNDTLTAGTANDTLIGGGASDDYVVAAGTGTVTTIQNSTAADTLNFASGISLSNLTVSTADDTNGNLAVTLQVAGGGQIVIDGNLNSTVSGGDGSSTMLNMLSFADGSYASLSTIVAQLTSGPTATSSSNNVTLAGGVQNMILTGTGSISATGNDLSDVITAGAGNDTLFAGTGNDTLVGSSGKTTYVIDADNSDVVINNSGSGDSLHFDGSVAENGLTTSSAVIGGVTVTTIYNNQGNAITINGGGLNQVSFADGNTTTLANLLASSYTNGTTTYSNINAIAATGITTLEMTGSSDVTATANSGNDTLISNSSGNDTLIAGIGNDTLVGGGASDDYVIANGNQTTTINKTGFYDTLTFGSGVTLADLSATTATATDGSTTLTIQNSLGGAVVIYDYVGTVSVDQIQFAGGATASLGALLAQATTGTSAATSATNVTLAEGVQNMTLTGTTGVIATANNEDDIITTNSGNDTLISGMGNDTFIGGSGKTTYEINPGTGNLVVNNSGSSDSLVFGAGIGQADLYGTSAVVNGVTVTTLYDDQGGTIAINGGMLSQVTFADNSTTTLAQLTQPTRTIGSTVYSTVSVTAATGVTDVDLQGTANISAVANTGNDLISSNAGRDTLVAGAGNDTLSGDGGITTFNVGALNWFTTLENVGTSDTLSLSSSAVPVFVESQAQVASDGSTTVTVGDRSSGYVTINDYQPGQIDQISIAGGPTLSLSALLANDASGVNALTSATNVTLAGGVQNMTLSGSALMATGNNLDDVIKASAANDTLIAGSANDTLYGSGTTTFEVTSPGSTVTVNNTLSADMLVFKDGATEADMIGVSGYNSTLNGGSDVVTVADINGSTVNAIGTVQNGYAALSQVEAGGSTFTVSQLPSSLVENNTLYSVVNATASGGVTTIDLMGEANISATANSLADTIYSNSGSDTLVAGSGNDTLVGDNGEGGANTYFIGPGSGVTTIVNAGNEDIISFGAGAFANDISATRATAADGSTTVTITDSQGNAVIVDNYTQGMVDQINFANTYTVSLGALLAQQANGPTAMTSAVSTTVPFGIQNLILTGNGNLSATGNSIPDVITGNSGNDSLSAGAGNDTLVAGTGSDTLVGGTGTTTYVFGKQTGNTASTTTTINNSGSNDVLVLGAGITLAGITANQTTVSGGATVTTLNLGPSGTVVIDGGSLNNIDLANGDALSLTDLIPSNTTVGPTAYSSTNDTVPGGENSLILTGTGNISGTANNITNESITANSGNDTLIAGNQNDTLYGGSGNDTLESGLSGNDTLIGGNLSGAGAGATTYELLPDSANVVIDAGPNDTLDFSPGVNMSLVQIQQTPTQLLVTLHTGASASLVDTVNGGIANIEFPDGNEISLASYLSGNYVEGATQVSSVSATLQGGLTNLSLYGSGIISGTANNLNDVITGSSTGNDSLIAGAGNDTLAAGGGNDTLVGGTGNTTFELLNYNGGVVTQNTIGANGGVITQSTSGETLQLSFLNFTGQGDSTAFGQLVASGAITATAVYLANGSTQVEIGDLDIEVGPQGMLSNVVFQDNTRVTVDQILNTNPNNTITTSTGGTLAANVVNATFNATNSSLTCNALDDLINVSQNNDTLTGGAGNDWFQLGNQSAEIIGGTGHDSLTAGGGNDTIIAGTGGGAFEVGNGTTIIEGSTVSDTVNFYNIGANASDITATTGTTNGVASATLQSNASVGGTVIVEGSDATILFADGTSTTLSALLAATNITSSTNTTMPGGATTLTLTGTGSIKGVGNSSPDTIIANSGNDTLVAGSGLATLVGGSGNDTFVVNNAADVISEVPNSGNNIEQSSVSVTLAANVESLQGTGTSAITLTGNSGNSIITANNASDTLVAGSGLSTLIGGTGKDTFVINNSGVVVQEATSGTGSVIQSSANYVLPSNVVNLTGTGSGSITLTANTLADKITANSGNDTLVSGSGVDTLVAGSGNDTFIVNNSSDAITISSAKAGNVVQSYVNYVLPTNLTNLVGEGGSNLTLTGNASADTITANSGNDTLKAGSGVATMIGGAGNDTFVVDNASDVITEAANSGNNTEQTSASVTLAANVQNLTGTGSGALTLTGNTTNDDVITANTGADSLVAGSGNATLISGAGVDTMVAGAGNDTFVVANSSDVITASTAKTGNIVQSSVSYVLAANLLNLSGTASGNISLTGNALADTITANSGTDTLISGTGVDTLVGGSGNDTFVVNNSNDAITVSSAKAGNVVQSSVNYVLPANLLSLSGTNTSNISLTGNTLADKITANSGNDTLVSGTGIDTLVGGSGNDTFVINNSSDAITVTSAKAGNVVQSSVNYVLPTNLLNVTGTGSSNLSLTGNASADTITANSGNDTLVAGSGVATLVGGAGNDVFNVNNTADVVTATAGSNVNTINTTVSYTASTNVQDLFGSGSGTITLTGNSGNDLIIGGTGTDSLVGGSGASVLEAGSGNDTLKDTAAANALIGGAGNDTLIGGTGVSFIAGGTGNDAITLGSGTAVVAFNSGDGKATIAPGSGTSDVLSLGGGIAYANLTFSKSGNNLIMNTGGNNSITFTNWYAGAADQNFVNLQVIEQAASTYSASSTNVLYNEDVEEFSFTQLVTAFNAALTANPSLTSWSLSNALLTDHLSGSNTTALGGDLAYYDGLNGNLTGMNLGTAVSTLSNSSYGKTVQTLDAWSGISNGNNKLH